MARRHRDDGPARTRTGREVGVDAPGTGTTERATNGPQWFYWGRAAVVDVEAAARRFFPALGSRCVPPDGTCGIARASTRLRRSSTSRKEVPVGPVRVRAATRGGRTLPR